MQVLGACRSSLASAWEIVIPGTAWHLRLIMILGLHTRQHAPLLLACVPIHAVVFSGL